MTKTPTLDVVVPVYHEGAALYDMLQEWASMFVSMCISYRFILCVDGSDSPTYEAITRAQHARISILIHKSMKRRGYGRAMLDGINTAMTEYVLCVDSDGQYDPKDFAGLWQNRMHASVIRGIRSPRVDSAYRIFMSFCFGLVFRMLFPSVYSDMSSPLTLFRRASLHSLHKQLCYLNEGFWWGFMGTCIKNNISIYELPCHHRRRVEGTTVVYVPQKILQIGIRNFLGIIKLWAA